MGLVNVYSAPDEFSAMTIVDLLKESDIDCVIRKHEIAGFNFSIGQLSDSGSWGELLVDEAHREKAKELIAGFQGTLGELAEAEPIDMPEEE